VFIIKLKIMTAYIQTLRNKSIQSAQNKLSKHRELGTKTTLNVFEVAELMDTLKFSNFQEESKASVFYSIILN
jgi:hypothetical protein